MTIISKTFKNGRSQAVRIPKAFEFKNESITLAKVGNAVILRPEGDLSALHESAKTLGKAFEDFVLVRDKPRKVKEF